VTDGAIKQDVFSRVPGGGPVTNRYSRKSEKDEYNAIGKRRGRKKRRSTNGEGDFTIKIQKRHPQMGVTGWGRKKDR